METMFQDSNNKKLGRYGETIVIDTLKDMGYYDIDHLFMRDEFAPYDFSIKKNNIKYICNVKTKKRRESYRDTGIDKKQYNKFYHMKDKYNIILFFVDFYEKEQKIYYLNFNKYYNKCIEDNNIMYWDINKYMQILRELHEEEVKICNLYRRSNFKKIQ